MTVEVYATPSWMVGLINQPLSLKIDFALDGESELADLMVVWDDGQVPGEGGNTDIGYNLTSPQTLLHPGYRYTGTRTIHVEVKDSFNGEIGVSNTTLTINPRIVTEPVTLLPAVGSAIIGSLLLYGGLKGA